ncbi:white collar-2 [Microthyrium microscopicum]|uniref:White collar-2 n=1 Tax=Microthyrium microscopicum TaxID=703497 RepID=A0A6A6TZD9_9PEZI|nr:white collar-2 [Microthyrium microscopicum]
MAETPGTSTSNYGSTANQYAPDSRASESTTIQASLATTSSAMVPANEAGSAQVGAGPLPTGFGVPPAPGTGSTLTEFTKRRHWSRQILAELKDLLIILSPDGRMQYVSQSCKELTGHEPSSLKSRFLVDYVHPLDKSMVRREYNESIASQNQLRFFYRFEKADQQSYAIFEAYGHPHFGTEVLNSNSYNEGARICRGVFIVSRPYPEKNAHMLDSFLEHKIENERLLRKIEELKREEKEELEQEDQMISRRDGQTITTASDDQRTEPKTETDNGAPSSYDGMPPPPKPSISNTALTRQNLSEALAASRPDSINDKMARYEGATPIEHIEMLTGLRHGERSHGISTGAVSPALIKGDAGIAISTDREQRAGQEKKKKIKLADEYVCTDCGTLDSPEWRKGPNGPKTLCNACGLRWAKKEKKRAGPSQSQPSQGTIGS